jgi:hypothetical protein
MRLDRKQARMGHVAEVAECMQWKKKISMNFPTNT